MSEQLTEQEKAIQAIMERYTKQIEKMADEVAEEIAKVFEEESNARDE